MKQIKFLFLFVVTLLSTAAMRAQTTASGTVVDNQGEPIIGASVVQQGSSKGTITDINGYFTVSVPDGSSLVISYIGYVSKTVKAGSNIRVTLLEDQQTIDDVVVIGYGVQKKSVVTAAIAKVTSDDLAKADPIRIDDMLKGLAAGVNVTAANGQPGSFSKVLIRGVGSVNNTDPLYVVDGSPMDGGLDNIDPNDIASVEVLKDAASCAVYGTRGANGVILITTKTGSIGKPSVSYDFQYGWQSVQRQRKLLDATQYATVMNWASDFPDGQSIGLPTFDDPKALGKGTNWQDAVFNNGAPVVKHNVNVSGGTDRLRYYLSMNFMNQEGIIGGNYDKSNYKRLSLRSNTTYTLWDESKNRNWLKDMKLTVNINYVNTNSSGVTAGSLSGSPLGDALLLPPTMDIYAPEGEDYSSIIGMYGQFGDPIYDKLTGKLLAIPDPALHEIGNPLADLSLPGVGKNSADNVYATLSLDLGIWDNLRFKTTFSPHLGWWRYNSFQIPYYLNANATSTKSQANDEMHRVYQWQIENVLSYSKAFGEHSIDVMVGQSALKRQGNQLFGYAQNLINYDPNHAYNIDFTNSLPNNSMRNGWGGDTDPYSLASYFGRVSYNYAERYMLQATLRRDGSSLFGANNKWGTFPSVSAGWNITNEPWLAKRPDWFTTAKLRFSWGKNGSDASLQNHKFAYTTNVSMNNNYVLGNPNQIFVGSKPSGTANPDLRWEQSEQYDIGLDLGFLNGALTFTADWYYKKTVGMLDVMPTPGYLGEAAPWGNLSTLRNEGVEFEASYRFSHNDFDFSVKANAAYNSNKVLDLGTASAFYTKNTVFQLQDVSNVVAGYPYEYFWGLKTAGVFQNQAQIDAYVGENGEKIQPAALPGDVIFVDVNGDGVIDPNDRTNLGNSIPAWNFGLSLNAAYKDFDFSMLISGVLGANIVDATRRLDLPTVNLPEEFMDSWHGEGTSNFLPRYTGSYDDGNHNWKQFSDLYIRNGNYARIKNIQIGYTLPRVLTRKVFIQRLRVFVAADNLFTITSYKGLDPEIQASDTNTGSAQGYGVDTGWYPQPRTFTIGATVSF